jgi:hypothetical protein
MVKLALVIVGLVTWMFRTSKPRRLRHPAPSPQPPAANFIDRLEQQRREFHNLLDFELGKTHQTIFEAGKTFGSAFLTYALLLSITALLIFGRGVEGKVSVPLLQLQLDKDWAAGTTLVMSNLALLWFFSTFTYLQMLEYKLWMLLNKRYSVLDNITYRKHLMTSEGTPSLWHLFYPSSYMSLVVPLGVVPDVLRYLFIILAAIFATVGIYGLSLYFAWQIGKATFLWLTVATLLPVLIAQLTYAIFLRRNLKKLEYKDPEECGIKIQKWTKIGTALEPVEMSPNTKIPTTTLYTQDREF